jgi:hypothetical protein
MVIKTFDKEVMPLCCVPFRKKIWSKNVVLNLVDNIKQICRTNYSRLCFSHYKFCFLGVQKGIQFFALVVIFWGVDQVQKHITIGLFKAFETSSSAMAENHDLLEQYDLTKKNINYVKNEGFKLNTMAIAFKFVINYNTLGVMEIF